MDIILLWTIWATAFTSPPDLETLDRMCRSTHPQGRLSVSQEVLSWNDRHYPAAMIICSRPASTGSGEDATPGGQAPDPAKRPV